MTMTTAPTLPAQRYKQITDLPNEVLQSICEYLVPDRCEPIPFSEYEVGLSSAMLTVSGWSKCKSLTPLHGRDNCSWRRGSYLDKDRMCALFDTNRPDRILPNDLANFAATCKLISLQAQMMTLRRPFSMTVNNAGIVFDNVRDAAPLQVFANSRTYMMVDNSTLQMQEIPKDALPGNSAFSAFRHALRNLSKLDLHVELDMRESGRTTLFVERIAQVFTALQDGGHHLSSVGVDLSVGFGHAPVPDWVPFSRGLWAEKFINHEGMNAARSTFAEAAASKASKILRPLCEALRRLSFPETQCPDPSGAPEGTDGQLPVLFHITWLGSGRLWNMECILIRDRRRPVSIRWGDFDWFFWQLVHNLFHGVPITGGHRIPGKPYTRKFGFLHTQARVEVEA